MNDYTIETMEWLDNRFRKTDSEGIYIAHQPIYGFRKGHCDPNITLKLMTTYQILNSLCHIEFSSLLDVGGAEGYKSALIRSLFDVKVRTCDLSEEACKRAKEIFDIDGDQVDIHSLPYKDNEFDVVLCSETLEHVTDLEKATKELVRVCSKAVIITVPHDKKEHIEENIKQRIHHAHIHCIDMNTFDFTVPIISKILSRKMLCNYLIIPSIIVDAMRRESVKGYSQNLVRMYNLMVPAMQTIFGKKTISVLIRLDSILSNFLPFLGMIFVLLKDTDCYLEHSPKSFEMRQLLDFSVPYYYLSK